MLRRLSLFPLPRARLTSSTIKRNFCSSTPKGTETPPPPPPGRFDSVISWRTLAVSSAILGGFAWYNFKKREEIERKSISRQRSVGKAAIGGPYVLVDMNGKIVDSSQWKPENENKWTIIYFGFTFCPDVCPVELEKLAVVLDTLKQYNPEIRERLQPLFISVDPWRDTVGVVREYLEEFHPEILGLTGTPEQIADVCRKFRVYSSKAPTDDNTDDYLVDHTIFFYLMSPDNEFLKYYGQRMTADQVINSLKEIIGPEIKTKSFLEKATEGLFGGEKEEKEKTKS